jgi:hypothetical protein
MSTGRVESYSSDYEDSSMQYQKTQVKTRQDSRLEVVEHEVLEARVIASCKGRCYSQLT